MIDSSKLLVLNLGGSADLGYMRITMVHANHTAPPPEQVPGKSAMASSKGMSSSKENGSGANSGKSGSSSSSTGSALSFSGGAAAGWVI